MQPYGTGRPEAVLYRIVHAQPDLEGLPPSVADLVTAAGGSIAVSLLSPRTLVIGASGAIFGLFGIYIGLQRILGGR